MGRRGDQGSDKHNGHEWEEPGVRRRVGSVVHSKREEYWVPLAVLASARAAVPVEHPRCHSHMREPFITHAGCTAHATKALTSNPAVRERFCPLFRHIGEGGRNFVTHARNDWGQMCCSLLVPGHLDAGKKDFCTGRRGQPSSVSPMHAVLSSTE
eukprot:4103109-Pleurochrysis_carterae.AAC.1